MRNEPFRNRPIGQLQSNHYMLESFVINICVPTTGNDYYPEVAINQYPIVVLGRESELNTALKSPEIRSFIKQHIRQYSLYKDSKFYIRHLLRDNTDRKLEIPVRDLINIPESEWESIIP